jgi:hypothetical protein
MFKTIENDGEADITEKKSKFIANVFYIKSITEAEEKIKQIKRKIILQDIIAMHTELQMIRR